MEKDQKSQFALGTVFVLTGLFIGVLLTLQFRSSLPPSNFLSDELRAQRELITSYLTDQSFLKAKTLELRQNISQAQEAARLYVEENNLEMLKRLQEKVGLEKIRGAGVEVVLNDGFFVNRESVEGVSQSLIHASDLRDVVNILRAASAGAIAINDQRIISTTSINSIGNTILVNNFHLLPPFTITATGEPDVLIQRLQDRSSLSDLYKRADELKIQLNLYPKDGVLIPSFNGNLRPKFIVLNETP